MGGGTADGGRVIVLAALGIVLALLVIVGGVGYLVLAPFVAAMNRMHE